MKMDCALFLKTLDERGGRLEISDEMEAHAASCGECAFALKLERELEAAPSWAERPVMAQESRARVLAGLKVAILFGRRNLSFLEDSAVTAAVLLAVAIGLFYALPTAFGKLLPAPVRELLAPYLAELAGAVAGLRSIFSPLTQYPLGMLFIAVTAFAVFLAAVMSARVMMPKYQV